ncbi:glycosyltransferase [Limosilactobacillus vaginalis]|nr:glycosyltransferase [Limosilactobacillus vaginalis]
MYVGRIVKAKRLDKALEAVCHMPPTHYQKFNIWGYGTEESKLRNKYKDNSQIIFNGAMNHFDVSKAYQMNKVFISLNPAEPFGITYEEAIANGLYVVAPNTGGGVEFLKQFPNRCSLVDVNDIQSIINGLEEGLHSNLNPLTDKELDSLSYSNTAKQIFKVIGK